VNFQPLHYFTAAEIGNLAWAEVVTFQLSSSTPSNSDNEIKNPKVLSPNEQKIPHDFSQFL